MKKCGISAIGIIALAVAGCANPLPRCQPEPQALTHNVYFALHDASDAARAKLIAHCREYLSGEPGILAFAVGEVVEAHAREVNVRDWDVGLHIVFKNKHYHDLYQEAPDHQKFIDENRHNWKSVRVFDTIVR